MAIWPASLPPQMLIADYQEQLPSNVIRTAMDTGPPKMRPRFTAAVRPLRGAVILTLAQRAVFENFYLVVLSGVLPFDWIHPVTQQAATFRFVTPPVYSALSDTLVRATLDLEQMP